MIQATWKSLSQTEYDEALEIQNAQATRLLQAESDEQTIFTVEHPPTITIGKDGTPEHIIASETRLKEIGMKIYSVDRGGDVTYHGPGQLVVYPVLHLGPWGNDVRKYVRMLEETVIRTLRVAGLHSERMDGFPGVWIGDQKICAIGVRARRKKNREFVTSHGLALNIAPDLSHFSTIIPCGLSNKGVTSIAQELKESSALASVTFSEWESHLQAMFADVFELRF
jgi:lipoyl(octanoyl) transferase